MGVPELTRRSLLQTGAGALAGVALRPAAALASAGRPERFATVPLGSLHGARTLALPAGAAVAGLQWRGDRLSPGVEMRVELADGGWGPWVPAGGRGHGPDAVATGAHTGEPLWIGGARTIQVRSSRPLDQARLRLVLATRAALAPDPAHAAALALAQPVLAAGAGQPEIIARSVWATGIPQPRVAPAYGEVKLAFVHHTENPNGYSAGQVPAMLRAIFLFHREVNGWNDIGYNFVIDRFGRVWEARAGGIDEPVAGAQAGGYNFVSTGVAVLGSYSAARIPRAAGSALERLLAWKLSLHGTPVSGRVTVRVNPAGAAYSKYPARARVSLRRISGHRDADSTECPGNALYAQVPAIHRQVRRMTGGAVRATLSFVFETPGAPPAPQGTPAPAPSPVEAPQLLVTLVRLDGTVIAGVPVQLQSRTVARRGEIVTHATVAEGVTDATGRCVLPAAFAVGARAPVWVRAFYAGGAGGGAAVSQAVGVAPVMSPTPAPAPAPTS